MDNIDLPTVLAVLFSSTSFVHTMLSRARSAKLTSARKACENDIQLQFTNLFGSITTDLSEKVSTVVWNSVVKLPSGPDLLHNLDLSLSDRYLEGLGKSVLSTVRLFQKVDSSITRVVFLRRSAYAIFMLSVCVAVIACFVLLPNWIPAVIMLIVVIVTVAFWTNILITNDLIDEVERQYEL